MGTESLANAASAALGYVISTFGWVFVLASFGFLAFSMMLAVSRYGGIRLGGQDERPEFRTVSWWVALMLRRVPRNATSTEARRTPDSS